MTKPTFDNRITIGNIISIVGFTVAMITAWIRLEGKTNANAQAINDSRIEYRQSIQELKEQQKKREADINAFWQKEWPKVIEILNEVKHLREDIQELKEKQP